MKKFDHAIRVGDQIDLRSKEGESSLTTERVFGGICPASNGSPFYGCCFGQVTHGNKAGKKKLVFLGEVENELPEPFFTELVELSRNFFCWHWLYNSSDGDEGAVEGLIQLFGNYARTRDITQIKLAPGLMLDWNTGILTIQQWAADDALDIPPGTVLSAQLGKMTKADRHVSRRNFFYGPDALRALMGRAAQNRSFRSGNYAASELPFYYG
jgi:hypothetical protein